jgi:hypothetical protein
MSSIQKLGLLFIFLFVVMVGIIAQTEASDKITLKTGEVFVGKIQFKNAEMILIESKEGIRYQFPNSEIKSIEKIDLNNYNPKKERLNEESLPENKTIIGLVEFSAEVYSAKNRLSAKPGGQLSLTFGAKLFEQKSIFTGIGISLTSILNTKEDETINFLPLFVTLTTKLNNKGNAPYLGLRAGYSFALSNEMKGGLYSRLSAGWSHQLHENTLVLFGLHTDVQAFSGNLIETNQNGNYSYYGNSSLLNFGLNVGIEF